MLDPDGLALPFVVDGFYVIGPAEVAWRADDDFDAEEQTDPRPDRERVVGMRRRRERVVSPHRQGDRQERPGVFDEEPDSGQKLPVEILARRDAVRTDIADRGC